MKNTISLTILFFCGLTSLYSQYNTEIIDRVYNMSPHTIATGKIDNDNQNDIVIGSNTFLTRDLAWYQKIPDSTGYQPYLLQKGVMEIIVIKIFDMDNDGDNDIAVAGDGEDKILIYNQINPDSFYVQHTEYPDSTSLEFDQAVTQMNNIDVDNDGDMDLVFIGPYNASQFRMGWLENHGDTSKWSFHTIIPVVYGMTQLLCADFNNDGLTDIFSVDITPTFEFLYFKNIGGSFLMEEIPDTYSASFIHLDISDIDHDGFIDVLVFINSLGPGSYPLEIIYNQSGEFSPLIKETIAIIPMYSNFFSVDYDIDGDSDIVFQSSNEIDLIENVDADYFTPPVTLWDTITCNFINFQVADLNNDTLPDFLLNDEISLTSNNIFPLYQTPDSLSLGESIYNFSWFSHPRFADFNNDSILDIIASVNIGEISTYLWDETSSEYSNKYIANNISDPGCNQLLFVDAGDINNDQFADFIAYSSYSGTEDCDNLSAFTNNQDSSYFESGILMEDRLIHFGGGGTINSLLSDIDSDGDLDFSCISSWQEDEFSPTYYYLSVFENESGDFALLVDIHTSSADLSNLKVVDIDNDSDLDLLILKDYNQNLLMFENNGDFYFLEPVTILSSDTLTNYNIINSDSDDLPDILINFSFPFKPYLMKNIGGEFLSPELINPIIKGVGAFDLDFDGRDEMIGRTEDDSLVYIYNDFEFGLTGTPKSLPYCYYYEFTDMNFNGHFDMMSWYYNEMKMIYDIEIDTSYIPYVGIDNNNWSNEPVCEVYPNPCSDNFNITLSSLCEEINIVDVMGRNVLSIIPTKIDAAIHVNTAGLTNGIYFIEIKYESNSIIKKIIVLK